MNYDGHVRCLDLNTNIIDEVILRAIKIKKKYKQIICYYLGQLNKKNKRYVDSLSRTKRCLYFHRFAL